MITYLVAGTLLGLSAGFAPGPLLMLVITETLKHGIRTGMKVALVPVVTDIPIIILSLFLVASLSGFHSVMGTISAFGGGFLIYLGYENLRSSGITPNTLDYRPDSFRRGIIVNIFNPHPYLFWFSVGAPIINKAVKQDVSGALLFVGSFYLCLVGSKVILAIFVGRSRSFMTDRIYVYTMKALGTSMFVLAFYLFRDGLVLLGYPGQVAG